MWTASLVNTRAKLRALHRSWLTARGALQIDVAPFVTSTCQPVSWRLLSVAHTLQYNTIQDPCAVDTVDNSVSRSRLIMRKPLSRHFDDVVSNLQHNVLPGAHIDESHPSPNAFVQRSSLLDSKPSNGRFCSRKSLANGACCTDCNRSRRVAFDCVGFPWTPAIPPIRSE